MYVRGQTFIILYTEYEYDGSNNNDMNGMNCLHNDAYMAKVANGAPSYRHLI